MIRVLHFELTPNRGGIESLLLRVSKKILVRNSNIKFDFVTSEQDELSYEEELVNLGCNIYRIPSAKNIFRYVKKINQILSKNNYDVVHLHKNSLINIVPLLIAKYNRIPKIIVHSHNTSPTKGGVLKYMHYLNRSYVNNTSVVKVACSQLAKEWMFGKADDVFYIPNGIDISIYSKNSQARFDIRSEFNIKEDEVFLGCVGRLTKQKNHLFMLDVLKNLDYKYKLIIVGQGELKKEILKKIDNLGLKKRVYLTGERNDIPNILQGIDAFLMPSLHEGLPIAGIEAQAAGLPLIVSTNVSSELNLTGKVKFVELEVNKWVKELNNLDYNRLNDVDEIFKEKDYDLNETKDKFLKLYINNK